MQNELLEILGPPIAAGFMIALTHAPLGIEVLRRGIIFIDLAVAQIAGLGLVASSLFLHNPSSWLVQLIALSFAVVAGLVFRRIEKTIPQHQEAIIGCGFVLAASLALLLLADHPQGGDEVKHLLSGQMLFVTWEDTLKHAPVYVFILAVWFSWPQVRKNLGFYLLFALAITSSVQMAGVYVVFASLILPALAAVYSKRPHVTAWFCGITALLSGMAIATAFDYPAGPVIVLTYALAATIIRTVMKSNGGNVRGMGERENERQFRQT